MPKIEDHLEDKDDGQASKMVGKGEKQSSSDAPDAKTGSVSDTPASFLQALPTTEPSAMAMTPSLKNKYLPYAVY